MLKWILKKEPKASHNVAVQKGGEEFVYAVVENETILDSALAKGIPMPYSCQVGSCGECRCKVVKGKISQIKDLRYMFSDDEIANGFTLACQTFPRSNLQLRFDSPTQVKEGRIVDFEKLDEDLYKVLIRIEDVFDALVGQFFSLINTRSTSRYYSIVSLQKNIDNCLLEIHVGLKTDGVMSNWWRDIFSGEASRVIGVGAAEGQYSVRGKGNIISFASGSGLGVTVALITEYLRSNDAAEAAFFGVFRGGQSNYFENILSTRKEEFNGRLKASIIDSDEFYQRKQGNFAKKLTLDCPVLSGIKSKDVSGLICGSCNLVARAKSLMANLEVAEDKVSYDEFS